MHILHKAQVELIKLNAWASALICDITYDINTESSPTLGGLGVDMSVTHWGTTTGRAEVVVVLETEAPPRLPVNWRSVFMKEVEPRMVGLRLVTTERSIDM